MRQQRLLHPIFAIDEPTHRQPPKPSSSGILKQIRSERNPIAPKSQAVFTQAGPKCVIRDRTVERPDRSGRDLKGGRSISSYATTTSVRASSAGGTVRPSAAAVLILMIS